MWADLAYSLDRGRDRTLTRRGARALEVLSNSSADPPAVRFAKYDEFADATPEGDLIRVLDPAGRSLYPRFALAPPDFPWPQLNSNRADRFVDVTFRSRPYRVYQHPASLGSQSVLIVVGGQLEDNRQLLARFSAGLMAAIPALLAASALAGYLMSRRVLQPVDRITAAVRSISIGNLSERLPIRQTRDELERLAETFNQMLARLETAVAQIKRFTADASHELRSPLSYICAVTEYALRNPNLQADSRESFEGILEESLEATRLLEDMLMLARADAGHVDIQFEPTDLAALVKDVCEKARVLAEAKGHRLTVRCVQGPCEIRGDRSSLRRLIWTLLDNAIKYTPEGGSVDVKLHRNAEDVRLSVRDTGFGIPENLLPRVFERFFRADPARSQGEGTGLGLAIAKWIADVHQAAISVKSKSGAGSEFAVVFPLQQGSHGAKHGIWLHSP
jgi:heavy metal sensor kinase